MHQEWGEIYAGERSILLMSFFKMAFWFWSCSFARSLCWFMQESCLCERAVCKEKILLLNAKEWALFKKRKWILHFLHLCQAGFITVPAEQETSRSEFILSFSWIVSHTTWCKQVILASVQSKFYTITTNFKEIFLPCLQSDLETTSLNQFLRCFNACQQSNPIFNAVFVEKILIISVNNDLRPFQLWENGC